MAFHLQILDTIWEKDHWLQDNRGRYSLQGKLAHLIRRCSEVHNLGGFATSLDISNAQHGAAKHFMSGTDPMAAMLDWHACQRAAPLCFSEVGPMIASVNFCRSMEQMSKQASHTVYRSAASMQPHLRTELPQMNGAVDSPAYDESILERLQEVCLKPLCRRTFAELGEGDGRNLG